MKCKFCGKEIDEGSMFCGYCGKQQPKVKYCVKCGKEIDPDDSFCGYCGTAQNIVEAPSEVLSNDQDELLPSQVDLMLEPDTADSPEYPNDVSGEHTAIEEQTSVTNNIDEIEAPPEEEQTEDVLTEEERKDNTIQEADLVDDNTPNNTTKYVLIACLALLFCCVGGYLFYNKTPHNAIMPDEAYVEAEDSVEQESAMEVPEFPNITENGIGPFVLGESLKNIPSKGTFYDKCIWSKVYDVLEGDIVSTYNEQEYKDLCRENKYYESADADIHMNGYVVSGKDTIIEVNCNESDMITNIRVKSSKLSLENGIHVGLTSKELDSKYNAVYITEGDYWGDQIYYITGLSRNITLYAEGDDWIRESFNGYTDPEKFKKINEEDTTPYLYKIPLQYIKNKKLCLITICNGGNENFEDLYKEEIRRGNENERQVAVSNEVIGNENDLKKTLKIMGESAYLMSDDEIEKELIGKYFWEGGDLGFYISGYNIIMTNDFVKEVHDALNTSNINGTVPVRAEYERGNWYKLEKQKNGFTVYCLVGCELNIEVLVYSNAVYVGNKVIHKEKDPNRFVMVYTDNQGSWGYKSKSGQYEFTKNKPKPIRRAW